MRKGVEELVDEKELVDYGLLPHVSRRSLSAAVGTVRAQEGLAGVLPVGLVQCHH